MDEARAYEIAEAALEYLGSFSAIGSASLPDVEEVREARETLAEIRENHLAAIGAL